MTLWFDKRYHTLNYEMKNTFNEKVIKLSLNGGFTCPNRDGSLDTEGCVFCSESGSGDFASSAGLSITDQINEQIQRLSTKWPKGKYIAYFQNFSGTYGNIEHLKKCYDEAISHPKIIGLAIATRPDCLDSDILDLLDDYNKKTYLWIELGLQTIHEKTAKRINRHFTLDTFNQAIYHLHQLNIKTVVHLIFGLFDETKEDILTSVKYVSDLNVFGVKFHLLHIVENTQLANLYHDNLIVPLNRAYYIDLIVSALEILSPDISVHRLTGDAPWKTLIAPKWSTDKQQILNQIDKQLRDLDTYQGKKYVKP